MCCRDQNDRLYDNGKNPFYLIRLPVNDKCNSDIGRLSCDMAAWRHEGEQRRDGQVDRDDCPRGNPEVCGSDKKGESSEVVWKES